MGCDIHLRLEYRVKKETVSIVDGNPMSNCEKQVYKDQWQPCGLTLHEEWRDRVYGMFAVLSNVRNYWDLPHIEERGFPEDASVNTKLAYLMEVVPDEEWGEDGEKFEYRSGSFIDTTRAEEWLKDGDVEEVKIDRYPQSKYRYITNPDYHSANWCTTEEMENCINTIFFNKEHNIYHSDFKEWLALLGAMKGYETGGFYECRAVFWFDN